MTHVEDSRSCTSGCPGSMLPLGQSPSPSSSWDGVFEASDLLKDKVPTTSGTGTVKRALFSSNQGKGEKIGTSCSSIHPGSSSYLKAISSYVYPSHLKILASKLALNSGKSHLNSRGKLRLARQLRQPCHVNCMRCENPRLTDVERHIIFNRFWSLNNHEQQWRFIFDSIKISPPRRKSALAGAKGGKTNIRSYYFTVGGKLRKVCKTMFKNTLCICDSWIDSAMSHFYGGKHVPDMRGKKAPIKNN